MKAASPLTPPYVAPQPFTDADAALQQVQAIYRQSIDHLREQFRRFIAEGDLPQPVRAFYPLVRVHTHEATQHPRGEQRHTFGFVAHAGVFETTLTDPLLFADYVRTQFQLLLQNHADAPIEVATSHQPPADCTAFRAGPARGGGRHAGRGTAPAHARPVRLAGPGQHG